MLTLTSDGNVASNELYAKTKYWSSAVNEPNWVGIWPDSLLLWQSNTRTNATHWPSCAGEVRTMSFESDV